MVNSKEMEELIEKLSPNERKIIPHLSLPFEKIIEKSGLDYVSVLKALDFLQSKGIVKIVASIKTIIDLGTNGIYYKKNHLPERKLLILLEEKKNLSLEEAKKQSNLSDNEFKVSLGVLKSKAMINLTNGRLSLNATKEELIKKSLEEHLIEALPLEKESLTPEQKYALNNLQKRKDIVEIKENKMISIILTAVNFKIQAAL